MSDYLPYQNGEIVHREPLVNWDAASNQWSTPRFAQLAQSATAAGVPGGPWSFDPNAGTPEFWKTLCRIRDAMAPKIYENQGALIGRKEWAHVSDPYLFTGYTGTLNSVRILEVRGSYGTTLNFSASVSPIDGRVYSDIEWIGKVDAVNPVQLQAQTFIAASESGSTLTPFQINVERPGNASAQLSTVPNSTEVCSVAVSLVPVSDNTRVPAYTVSGRTDLFEVSRTVYSNNYPNSAGLTVYFRLRAGAVIGLNESIHLDVTVTNFQYANSKGRNFTFLHKATATDHAGAARVISPVSSDWGRYRAPITRVYKNGSEWRPFTPNAAVRLIDLVQVVGGSLDGMWRARTFPPYRIGMDAIQGAAERVRRTRYQRAIQFTPGTYNNLTRPNTTDATTSSALTTVPLCFNANTQQVRAPMLQGLEGFYADANRPYPWAETETMELTIPAAITGTLSFTLPAIRLPANSYTSPEIGAETVSCQYYKIPLPVTRETEKVKEWLDRFGVPLAAANHTSQNMPTDPLSPLTPELTNNGLYYFHDARLTSEDGQTFWYQDVVTTIPTDIEQKAWRIRYWFIGLDGNTPTLYLLLQRRTVKTSPLPAPNGTTAQVLYFPQAPVTPAMYKAAWHSSGNWADFNAPFRIFTISDSPIPLWTVGKTSGGQWTPGAKLKLHLPKAVSRGDVVEFQGRPMPCVDYHGDETDFSAYIGGTGQFDIERRTQLFDLSITRQPHKTQFICVRNGGGQLAHWPVTDLRFFTTTQSDAPGAETFYPETLPADFRKMEYEQGDEICPADYTVSDTGAVTFKRASEFDVILAVYQTRAVSASPEIAIALGNHAQGSGTMTEYKRVTIPAGSHELLNPFMGTNTDGDQVIENRWIFHRYWPLCYQRIEGAVTAALTTAALTTGISDGILATATVEQDCTLRCQITAKDTSGNEIEFTTDIKATKGANILPPKFTVTEPGIGADVTVWMTAIEIISVRQRFDVKLTGREIFSDPSIPSTNFAPIVGTPTRIHFNETKRLLEAYAANT